ncbi:hypothetical protein KFL_011300010 [Klebsormidium nitens]|uniref:Uncharacterized protein n=1 Tax=Klebsormidium nitens TaxID=105231 RepID=A0A1Y1IPK8_KLENI|nr:hypothetical protein KFL_011300010 [Klebsormidium nitens]|eukprot:GAQ92770.1 hypothetical protein KFL_011300010 [Klebsormidium nitens]
MKSFEECCEECQEQNPFFRLGGNVVGKFAYTRDTPFIQPFESIESPWTDYIKSDSLETNIKKLYKLAQKYSKSQTEKDKKAEEESPGEEEEEEVKPKPKATARKEKASAKAAAPRPKAKGKEKTPQTAYAGDTISITLPENSIVNLDAFTLYAGLNTPIGTCPPRHVESLIDQVTVLVNGIAVAPGAQMTNFLSTALIDWYGADKIAQRQIVQQRLSNGGVKIPFKYYLNFQGNAGTAAQNLRMTVSSQSVDGIWATFQDSGTYTTNATDAVLRNTAYFTRKGTNVTDSVFSVNGVRFPSLPLTPSQIWMENLHNMGLSADIVGAMDTSLNSLTKFTQNGFFHYFKFNVDNDESTARLSSGLDTRGSASTITWQTTGGGSSTYLPTVFVECTGIMEMSDTSIEPIEEVAETVEETVEAPAAAATGKVKKPCSPEKLKQMALMREKAKLKKQAMKELTEKEKALKQKTFEERVKKVQALEKAFEPEPKPKPKPEPKAPEPAPLEESEAEVEVVKVKKVKKPKKVKKVIYESDSDSSASSESDDDAPYVQRKQKRRFQKTVRKEVAKEMAKLTAARPTQRDIMQVAARDELNSKVSKAMREMAMRSVFPE